MQVGWKIWSSFLGWLSEEMHARPRDRIVRPCTRQNLTTTDALSHRKVDARVRWQLEWSSLFLSVVPTCSSAFTHYLRKLLALCAHVTKWQKSQRSCKLCISHKSVSKSVCRLSFGIVLTVGCRAQHNHFQTSLPVPTIRTK